MEIIAETIFTIFVNIGITVITIETIITIIRDIQIKEPKEVFIDIVIFLLICLVASIVTFACTIPVYKILQELILNK